MKRFKEILIKLLFPPARVIILCCVTGFPLVIFSLIYLSSTNPISYVSYVISAYALTVLCTNFPKMRKRCKELIHGDEVRIIVNFRSFMNRYKYTSMYLNEREFRAKISLYTGFAINVFYAVFKCATGAYYRSAWLWAIGIYYIMLSSIRFMLLKNVHITDIKERSVRRKIHEYKTYRGCGIMMILLNTAMAGMTVQMIWKNRGYEYPGFIIYISALYTFYCFISSLTNAVSFAKRNNPILSAAKNLNFIGAMMSMFTLQTAMITQFGNDETFRRKMNSATGGAVLILTSAMSVFMIIHANKNLRRLENNQGESYGK